MEREGLTGSVFRRAQRLCDESVSMTGVCTNLFGLSIGPQRVTSKRRTKNFSPLLTR